jgi:hypothetical protein
MENLRAKTSSFLHEHLESLQLVNEPTIACKPEHSSSLSSTRLFGSSATARMASPVPTTMKAVVANQSLLTRVKNMVLKSHTENGTHVAEVPVPPIAEGEILVKVRHVALNPTDWKHADFLAAKGVIIGCDFAGTVAKIGAKAPGNWTIGDRVAGAVHAASLPTRDRLPSTSRLPVT